MRVLHVIPSTSPVHGGPSHVIVAMSRALEHKGVAVVVATTNDDGPGRIASVTTSQDLGDIAFYRVRKWADAYTFAPGLVPWLWRNVRAFDVVHIHALFSFSSTVGAWIASCRGVPYVVRPLGTLSRYALRTRRPRIKRLMIAANEGPLLRRAAAVHFTSESERLEADELGFPFTPAVIPLGVDPAPAGDRARLLARFPELADKRIVLFLSRLDPKKNLESLIDAMKIVVAQVPDATLLVAGQGDRDYERSLRARAVGLSDRIVWAGHVTGSAKADAFAGAELFVLPSFSENFGIAAIEAMSSGCPCLLGVGVGDAARLATEGAIRSVQPVAEEIASAIISVLGDEAERRQLGRRARLIAEREFGTDVMADRLIELYRTIARGATH